MERQGLLLLCIESYYHCSCPNFGQFAAVSYTNCTNLYVFADIVAPSHLSRATSEADAEAALAERSKQEKYLDLDQCHTFTPVAIETVGPFGPETLSFLRELGCCLKQVTGEAKSFSYLQQCLSVAVQLGNAAAVMGSMGSTTFLF